MPIPLHITEVVEGGAPGFDAFAKKWAKYHGIPVKEFAADWDKHGRAAGPRRNEEMARYADALIAFHGGKGTDDMIRRARKHGLVVYIAESGRLKP
jgi:hypothetical protein